MQRKICLLQFKTLKKNHRQTLKNGRGKKINKEGKMLAANNVLRYAQRKRN